MAEPSAVIATVPWTDSDYPLMAPAALKAALNKHSIQSVTVDLNAEIRRHINNHPKRDGILKFFLTEQIDPDCRQDIYDIIDRMAQRLLQFDTPWILLSLLTYLSQIPNYWLCFRIKQLAPDKKIVIGGPGCFVTLKSFDDYTEKLLKLGFVDHYVSGDGELSLPNLMIGNTGYPGIDSKSWQQIDNINTIAWPNFQDYDWSLYAARRISITGSRGCVRKCTFCDIHEHWSKYQWKTGQNLFDEIMYQKSKYGINFFSFSDSLVNGNQKEYRYLITKLADYNQQQSHSSDWIRWSGSFIIRPRDQMKEEDWQLTAASGATILSVGVESFVEHIRYHIQKKFSNQDLDFALEMGQKYNVAMLLLMIVGYVTETQKDFDEALEWIKSHRHFAGSPVRRVQIGSGLGILPGTTLYRQRDKLGIKLSDSTVTQDWVNNRTGSDPNLRMKWHRQMKSVLEQNGFEVDYLKDNHTLIENYINEKYASN